MTANVIVLSDDDEERSYVSSVDLLRESPFSNVSAKSNVANLRGVRKDVIPAPNYILESDDDTMSSNAAKRKCEPTKAKKVFDIYKKKGG